jgi:hypothetical protein
MADAEALDKARRKLDDEFAEVQRSLGDVHVAYQAVVNAEAEDNLHDLLKVLEKAVKEARDGGIIGSGANDHRRALDSYLALKNA